MTSRVARSRCSGDVVDPVAAGDREVDLLPDDQEPARPRRQRDRDDLEPSDWLHLRRRPSPTPRGCRGGIHLSGDDRVDDETADVRRQAGQDDVSGTLGSRDFADDRLRGDGEGVGVLGFVRRIELRPGRSPSAAPPRPWPGRPGPGRADPRCADRGRTPPHPARACPRASSSSRRGTAATRHACTTRDIADAPTTRALRAQAGPARAQIHRVIPGAVGSGYGPSSGPAGPAGPADPRRWLESVIRSGRAGLVADPADRHDDLGTLGVVLDLAAQSLDVDVDQPGCPRGGSPTPAPGAPRG